jgi:hypothetical protein
MTDNTTATAAVQLFTRKGYTVNVQQILEIKNGTAKAMVKVSNSCTKCGGRGRGPWYQDNGICYRCNGADTIGHYLIDKQTLYTAEKLDAMNAKLDEKRKMREDAFIANSSEILARFDALQPEFEDLANREINQGKDGLFSDAQTQASYGRYDIAAWLVGNRLPAMEKMVASVRTRKEQSINLPEIKAGRVTVSGEIKSLKVTYSDFGQQEKMLVQMDCGNRVYGSVPKAIAGCQIGDKVKFVGTVSVSGNDSHFGFFSRPSQASVI